MQGCGGSPKSTYFVDLAHGRFRYRAMGCPAPDGRREGDHEIALSDADREAIAAHASAMLRSPGPGLQTVGCGAATDGDNDALTITREDGRRERYGCGAPAGAAPIRSVEFEALLAKLDALRGASSGH